MERRLGEKEELLTHDEAFGWLRDVQEIVERHLLPVGDQVNLPGHPGFVCTVVVNGRAMIAATGQEGWLTLLAVDGEGFVPPEASLAMSGFDSNVDEVVTVFAHPRVLGARSDLFVAVRRWDLQGRVPALRMYRANAWWNEGRPHFTPGIEDAVPGAAWPCLDLEAGDIPPWVVAGPLSMAPGVSPLTHPPLGITADRWAAIDPAPAQAVAWDGERRVWLSSGRKLVVELQNSNPARDLPLDRAGTALAAGAAGAVPVAVVCGQWGVLGVPLADDEPEEIRPWLQRLPWHPVAVALLPKELGWPDVVVAARDGRLHRFRYVRPERTFQCRNRLIERMRRDLELKRLGDWVEWIKARLSEVDDRETRARIGRLLVRLVDLTKPTGSEVHTLARLLGGELISGAEVSVGKALGEALRSPAAAEEEIRCPWPDPETGPDSDLVRNALAAWAYDEGRFALQEELDIALGDRAERPASSATEDLSRNCSRNRWDEWATLASEERASFRRLTLLVDFAVERYLSERQDRAKGRWDRLTTCVHSGDLLAVGAGRDGLRIVRFQPSRESITHPSMVLDRPVDPRGLVPACLVQVSDHPPSFVLGEHAARARFFDLEGEWKVVYGPSGSSCAAIAVAPTATGVWCLLGWNEGRRCFLEIWETRPKEGSRTGGRVAYGPLGVRNVGGLGVLGPVREGTVELVAGDALTGDLVRIRAHRRVDSEDLDVGEEVWRVPLDGGVTAVHVDRERGRVLAGSVAGTTWAVDVENGAVLWTFRSRHAVRAIHAEHFPGEGGYGILAPPDDLVVVSKDRARVWRCRHGGPFGDLAAASLSGGSRLLAGTGDRLHVFRMQAPDEDWSTRTAEERRKLGSREPERFRHAEAVEVAAALEGGATSELLERLSRTRSRRARMEIVKKLAKSEAGPKERTDILDVLSWKETSALLLAFPPGAGEWERDIVDTVTSARSWGAEDRSQSAWSVALVELVRRLAARAEKVAEVGAVLQRVATNPSPDSAWLALEAGQAWLAAIAREVGIAVAEVPIDTVLEHVHQLPPSLATGLPLLVRTPGRARGLARLARWAQATEDDNVAELRGVADDLEKEETPLAQALDAALRIAAAGSTPSWEEVGRLIDQVREVRAPELWAELIRPVLLPADLGPPPDEAAPLAQQVDWLNRAVRRPAGRFDPDPPASWKAAARRVARLLDERLRWAYRQRLDEVEDIGRLRPEVARSGRPIPQRLDVTLRLMPEGRSVSEARITVRCPDLVSFEEGKRVEWSLYRRELRDGETPEHLNLRARCDAAAETFRVEVKVDGAGSYHYENTWDLPMPSADDARDEGGIAPFPMAVPTAYAAALEAVRQLGAGVAVVSADAAIHPAQLVQDVGRDAQSRIVNLDDLLSELGPGRRYPDLLRRPALLRALSGLGPHPPAGETPLSGVQAGGARRLVFWPCEETLERVLDSHLAEPRTVLRDVHEDSMHRTEGLALVFVLPSRLAARLRRWLGREVTWLAPATLDARWLGKSGFDKAETEAVAWLQKVAELDGDEAEEVFWRSGADLRVMHDWARRSLQRKTWRIETLEGILREWGRKDLAALDPFELAALLVVSGAVTAESFKRLEAGMVLAQDIRTSVRPDSGSQPKTIGHVGMVLTERLIRRLTSINPRPQAVWVGGIGDAGGATELASEVKALHELLGGRLGELAKPLMALGLAEKRGQLTQATSFCQCVVQSAVRSKGGPKAAYIDLAEDGHLLDGVPLERLTDISDAAAQVLGINTTLARLVGQLWSDATRADDPPGQNRAEELTRALAGQTAKLALRSSSGPTPASPLPADRCTLVGVDPSDTVGGYRYLFAWWSRPADPDWNQVDRWLDTLAKLRDLRGDEVNADRPLLLMLGPGAEKLPPAPRDKGIVVLRERDLRPVLAAETIQAAFWAAVRSHTGLARIAPFMALGALPPGSSIFVGRRVEREEVLAHIHSRSFLVLGPRQIGKTSLLNAIYDDLSKSRPGPDGIRPRPILLSLQGVKASAAIVDRLVELCKQADAKPSPGAPPIELLRRVGAAYRARDERAVLIVNEVDGLLPAEPEFFEGLRELHESGDMRFVLGGYTTAREALWQLKGPFFHFTSGASGKRYFDLSVLTGEEALELVDKLESEPLGLRWGQESEREEGRLLLVQRSYGVPWVIQALCIKLVDLLDQDRRPVLRLDDVRRVAEDPQPVLDHFDDIDLGELVGREKDLAVRLAGKALLTQVAQDRYFTGSAPAGRDFRLRDATPGYYSFTPTDAREMLGRAAATWLGKGTPADDRVQNFVRGLDIARLLGGLTLTLIVQEVEKSSGGEPDYAFQHHIYPLELARLEGGPEQRVADALEDLARLLATTEGGTP
ncbi:MAG TPA: AAA family ATPase [Thermoanaerobaculia bacterium]